MSHNFLNGSIEDDQWLCSIENLDLRDNMIACPLLSCCSKEGSGLCEQETPCSSPGETDHFLLFLIGFVLLVLLVVPLLFFSLFYWFRKPNNNPKKRIIDDDL